MEFHRRSAAGRDKGFLSLSGFGRLPLFSLVACVAYTAAYYFDWPLFRYYLGNGSFSFATQPDSAGAPILWYGWLFMAALIGIVAAVILPRTTARRLPADLLWIIPFAATLAAALYEVRWFI